MADRSGDAARQRGLLVACLGVVVVLAVALLMKRGSSGAGAGPQDGGAEAAAEAAAPTAAAPEDAGEASPEPVPADPLAGGADPRALSRAASRMPDGSPVPPLPAGSPRQVHFGVVLVTYAGAQDAPRTARPKADAAALATQLASDARTDFAGTVAKGDPGSAADVGRVPRGVLELYPEYVLFSLPPGGISDPLDTPKGFWIVKRID